MRDLRVVGVDTDGTHVICQDSDAGERYRIPADERLRAAARGDLSRLGQIQIEMDSSLRPREIQARIRAGASVAEVAAVAGVGIEKIERFAHPVLLERTRATELAALAHPMRHDGPSLSTLGDVVGEGLTAYGHSQIDADWDAWKGEDGYWVVQVGWRIGHTDHHAHWRFHPGSHGGTAEPLDDLSDELTHPETIEPRRRLTPVAMPRVDVADDGHEEVTFDADSLIGAQRTKPADLQPGHDNPPSDDHGTYALDFDDAAEQAERHDTWSAPRHSRQASATAAQTLDAQAPAAPTAGPPPPAAPEPAAPGPADDRQQSASTESAAAPTDPIADQETTASTPAVHETTDETSHDGPEGEPHGGPERPRRRKSGKPPVPAWEDVLLGVRSNTEKSS